MNIKPKLIISILLAEQVFAEIQLCEVGDHMLLALCPLFVPLSVVPVYINCLLDDTVASSITAKNIFKQATSSLRLMTWSQHFLM